MFRRLSRRVPLVVVDGVIAVVLTVVAQVELHTTVDDGYQAGPMWLNVPLVFLMTAPLVLRHVASRTTLTIMVGAVAIPSLFVAHTLFFWGGIVPIAIATYTVARGSDDLLARQAWLVGPVILVTGMLHVPELRTPSNIFFATGLYVAVWGAARVLRAMARQKEELADALAQLAERQAAREEAAVLTERNRIAAEMHDVVAHAVSLMVLQVGAARMSLEPSGTAPAQLLAAEDTGRQALTELRRTLDVLRDHSEATMTQPLPGGGAIDSLVASLRAAGLEVELAADSLEDLPSSLQLSAYRVLQEALTNALKHAGQVPVTAAVRRTGGDLVIEVTNPLPQSPTQTFPTSGHGLAGMRQRVAMFGGHLDVGTSGDAFAVRALLPIPATAVAT